MGKEPIRATDPVGHHLSRDQPGGPLTCACGDPAEYAGTDEQVREQWVKHLAASAPPLSPRRMPPPGD
jgi:hypothetical protein